MKLPWTIVTAALALACTTVMVRAEPIELPARKPGLWQMKVNPKPATVGHQVIAHLCLDAASDKTLMEYGLTTASMCVKTWSRGADGSYIFDVACDIIGQKSKTHGVLSGDFQSHYILDVDTEKEADATAPADISGITQEATWIGACQEGSQAGDMLLPGGRTINLLKAMREGG